MLRLCLTVALCLLVDPAPAQFTESFADGDFTAQPAWVGETGLFAVVPFGTDFALRADGPAASDTLHLATPSALAFGTWRFTVRYEGGALSNFNQVRVFLLADTPDLEAAVHGYHLQIGTNDRDLRLYRSEGGDRTLLAESADDLFPETERTLALEVTRTEAGVWTVALDGAAVFSFNETENRIETGTHFGLWVKHSSSRAQGFFFDDLAATEGVEDTTPPVLTSASYTADIPGFALLFSETLDIATLTTASYTLSGGIGAPAYVAPIDANGQSTVGVLLGLSAPLPTADYAIAVSGLADVAGNVMADTTVTVAVVADTSPPGLVTARALDAERVEVVFDEGVFGCDPTLYEIMPGIGMPTGVGPCIPEGGQAVYELFLAVPLAPATQYTLTARNVADVFGNVLAEGTVPFETTDRPTPGDLVLNEIMYDPPVAEGEYVELYNASGGTFDLATLAFSDDRQARVPITNTATPLAPGEYAVLVRDSLAFAAAFPGVAFIEVAGWPALNNGGDTPTLWHEETLLDAVPYEPAWGGAGVALERKDPNGPSDSATNWAATTDASGGTPGRANSVFEIDTTPPTLVSVLTSNNGDTLRVAFSEPLDPASLPPAAFSLTGPSARPLDDFEQSGALFTFPLSVPLLPGDYVFHARAGADFSGNTFFDATLGFSFFPPAIPQPGEIVVNEILFDPPEGGGGGEYVELFNRSDTAFALRDLALADDRRVPVLLPDAPGVLPPGGYAVLVQSGTGFAAAFPGVAFIEVAGWPALNNGGDAVVVFFGETEIDAVAYAPSWGGDGVALERKDPAGPSSAAANWASSVDARGGTPGAENSVFAPDETPPLPVFAEQTGPATVEVVFDEPLDPATATPDRFTLDGTTATAAVMVDDGSVVRLGFPDAAGTTLTVRGLADLTGNARATASVAVARRAAPGEVVIHEIMYDPRDDRFDNRIDQPEYVELFNTAAYPVSLSGFYWTDVPDETGAADTLRFAEGRASIAPGGFAVVFAQPVALAGEGELYTQSQLVLAFPEDYRALAVTLLPVRGAGLGLLNAGDRLRLHRPDDLVIDALWYDPGWHDAARATTDGVALERIAAEGPSDDALNWTSSRAALGGTPGLPNSVGPRAEARPPAVGDLVLNEILYAPRADPNDGLPDQVEYLELLSTADAPLDLNGLRLTDRPDEHGVADTLRMVFGPTALPPGGFAVVFAVPTGTPDDSLGLLLPAAFPGVPPDALLLPVRASLGLGNSGDLIRLHAPDGTVLEAVAYEPGWHHPSLEDASGTALERLAPAGGANDPANWTSSVDPSGGTPGQTNSVFFAPSEPGTAPGLTLSPSPFSPDRDGHDDVAAIGFVLAAEASLVRARIYDASGRLVRTLEDATLAGRAGTLFWDGLDDHDRPLPIGIYIVFLEAVAPDAGIAEAYKAPLVLARPLD